MQLGRGTSALPLGNLHLGTRSLHALRNLGITTVGEFAERGFAGCARKRGIGGKTSAEIYEATRALFGARAKDGSVDWILYARLRKFAILPAQRLVHWSGKDFAGSFPKTASTAVESRFGAAGLFVFRERLLKPWNHRRTLDAIGFELGVMWETVRRLELDMVAMFRRILLSDDYSGCRFRFWSGFLAPLRSLSAALISDTQSIQSISDCEKIFDRVWGVSFAVLGGQENALIDILGFRRVQRRWILKSARRPRTKVEPLRSVRKEIRETLKRPDSAHVSLRTLVRLLNDKFGEKSPSSEEIRGIVMRMSRGKARQIIRGTCPQRRSAVSITNACERLLLKAGKPIHFADLCASLNRAARFNPPVSPKLVSVYLQREARFVPIGCSGCWALAEWPNVDTRGIADIAEAMLLAAKEPLSAPALFELIANCRPVGRKSVVPMLHSDKRFKRTRNGLWRLARLKASSGVNG